jgi:ribosome-binding protein aMBF1 (putative translation factor)
MTPDRLRQCLELLGWSQRELANQLRRPEGFIRQAARGRADLLPEDAAWLEERAQAAERTPPPRRDSP